MEPKKPFVIVDTLPDFGIEIGDTYVFDYPVGLVHMPRYTAHAGQRVTVIRECTEYKHANPLCMPTYEVEAEDGWTGEAWADELLPVEGG